MKLPANLVVLHIFIFFPNPPATIYYLESSKGCFTHPVQEVQLHSMGKRVCLCSLHLTWNQNQRLDLGSSPPHPPPPVIRACLYFSIYTLFSVPAP